MMSTNQQAIINKSLSMLCSQRKVCNMFGDVWAIYMLLSHTLIITDSEQTLIVSSNHEPDLILRLLSVPYVWPTSLRPQ